MRKRTFRCVSFALMVSVLLLSPQVVRAAPVKFGASSGGNSEAHSCNADVWFVIVPVSIDVEGGEQILIWFNVTWYDNRSASSPPAVHYFKVNYTYGADADFNDYSNTTYGGYVARSAALPLTTDTVSESGTLGITWFASITVTSPYCYDSDTKVHGIGLA